MSHDNSARVIPNTDSINSCTIINHLASLIADSPFEDQTWWRDDAERTAVLAPVIARMAGTRDDSLVRRRLLILADRVGVSPPRDLYRTGTAFDLVESAARAAYENGTRDEAIQLLLDLCDASDDDAGRAESLAGLAGAAAAKKAFWVDLKKELAEQWASEEAEEESA